MVPLLLFERKVSQLSEPVTSGVIGGAVAQKLWLFLASFAGAVTSVALQKQLSWRGRLGVFMVGLLTAIFVSPAIVEWQFGHLPASSGIVSFVYYAVSVSSMSILPPFLKWAAERAGDPFGFITTRKVGKE